MDDGFVDVYAKTTGRKHRVPAHFMTNPVLSKPFRKTPKQRSADGPAASATPGTDVTTTTPATPTTNTPAAGDRRSEIPLPKSLADGHMKFTILSTMPEDPGAPTITELAAGIDMECNVLASDFTWTAADSDKVAEKALCDTTNANALGSSNFTAGFTVFRKFDATTGAVDDTEDAAYQAAKVKGTTLWGYVRKDGQLATADWAADDEIILGMQILTDNPQMPSDAGGYIKMRIPAEPQQGWPDITAAAAGA